MGEVELIGARWRVRKGRRKALILKRPLHLRPGDSYEVINDDRGRVKVAVRRGSRWTRFWLKVRGKA